LAELEPTPKQANGASANYRRARRVVRTVMGFTVIAFGLILAIPGVPGPGFVFVIAGLAILATEYVWARRYLTKIKEGGAKLGVLLHVKKKTEAASE